MDDGSISIVVTDPTGDINIVVYAYTDTDLQGMLDIGNSLLEGLTDLVIYDLVDAPIGGYGGYVLPYDYTADGVPHSGALTITYVPDTGMGYVIDLDTTEALLDTASPVLDTMIASLNFFAPVATAQ
jgi:hypothetical protein